MGEVIEEPPTELGPVAFSSYPEEDDAESKHPEARKEQPWL